MTDWSAGYMTDISYTYGYYQELNPLRVKLLFPAGGLVFPEVETACELGFGQGMSVGIHAAASVARWHGTDFNSAHAGFAQEMVAASGANAHLYDQSFEEFCMRADLPDFDFIGLHGIWSWISKENCTIIVDFIRRKLKVGGVLYISYNTQPGYAAMQPMRDLFYIHAQVMGAAGVKIIDRVHAAIEFTERMLASNPLYARHNPQIAERIKKIKKHNPRYVAHEYFHSHWQPVSFVQMNEWLTAAKLDYACSAQYRDHVNVINLTEEQHRFLGAIPDRVFREFVRDFMCDTQFRRDYWVKGARQCDVSEYVEFLRKQRVVLQNRRENVKLQVNGALGEIKLNENIYGTILDLLGDYKPRSLGEIERAVQQKNITFAQVLQAILILVDKYDVAQAQDDDLASKTRDITDRLNLHLMNKCRGSNDVGYLASPLTGGAVPVSRLQQLFLLADRQGKKTHDEWAQFAWQHLAASNQRMMKDGKPIESDKENLAEIARRAKDFTEERLSVLKKLMVI
jgi:methyltransferase-like protein